MEQHTRRRDSVWEVKTLTRNVPNCMRCMASRALPFPTLHHLIIAWHARPGRHMLPPVNARAMLAHRRNATLRAIQCEIPTQSNGERRQHRQSRHAEAEPRTLTRARARRDRDPPRRLPRLPQPRAAPAPARGSPGPAAPAPSPAPRGQSPPPRPGSPPRERRRHRELPNAARGNGRRGRRRRRLGAGGRRAGSSKG